MAQEWNVESSAPQSSPHAGSCPSGANGQEEPPGASLLGNVFLLKTLTLQSGRSTP